MKNIYFLRTGKKKNAHTYVHYFKLTCAENHSIPWPVGPFGWSSMDHMQGSIEAFTVQWHPDDIESIREKIVQKKDLCSGMVLWIYSPLLLGKNKGGRKRWAWLFF